MINVPEADRIAVLEAALEHSKQGNLNLCKLNSDLHVECERLRNLCNELAARVKAARPGNMSFVHD